MFSHSVFRGVGLILGESDLVRLVYEAVSSSSCLLRRLLFGPGFDSMMKMAPPSIFYFKGEWGGVN